MQRPDGRSPGPGLDGDGFDAHAWAPAPQASGRGPLKQGVWAR